MKYNGFYFWMFKSPMKKVLAEKYGREYAADIMKKSKKVYRELVEKADDIGDDNPMPFVPTESEKDGVHVIRFSRNRQEGRYGFLNEVYNSEDQ